jgi:type IV pilus assembly protein PilB
LDIPDVSELDLSKSVMYTLKRVMDAPYGLFLVTGPTGSGKTTTLFSMLKYLNKPELNITTIEDPVEYRLEGVNQVQVNLGADLDFPTSLRSFLRQDPDIILVGEIRDLETAEIACRAALTGHMVLATLHTNSAVQAVTRLADIGVQPHILAPSLVGVLAQRLVRRICEHCKEKYSVSAKEIGKFLISDGRDVSFSRGTGCEHCNDTGYSGRIAIHEAAFINAEIRALLVEGASPMAIFNCAAKSGYRSMRYDGIKKVLRGLTTMAEIERVTLADDEGPSPAVS